MVDLKLPYFQECVSKIMVLAKKVNVPFVVDGVSSEIERDQSAFFFSRIF